MRHPGKKQGRKIPMNCKEVPLCKAETVSQPSHILHASSEALKVKRAEELNQSTWNRSSKNLKKSLKKTLRIRSKILLNLMKLRITSWLTLTNASSKSKNSSKRSKNKLSAASYRNSHPQIKIYMSRARMAKQVLSTKG